MATSFTPPSATPPGWRPRRGSVVRYMGDTIPEHRTRRYVVTAVAPDGRLQLANLVEADDIVCQLHGHACRGMKDVRPASVCWSRRPTDEELHDHRLRELLTERQWNELLALLDEGESEQA